MPPGRRLPSSPFNARRDAAIRPLVRYEVGARVTHDQHGLGRVVAMGGDTAVYIDFGEGNRKIDLPTNALHLLSNPTAPVEAADADADADREAGAAAPGAD